MTEVLCPACGYDISPVGDLPPQTATETLEAYKALGENIDIIAGAYEQALMALKEAKSLAAERLVAIDELRAILTEVRAERDAEPDFLPGDLARSPSDTRPDSAFWPPVDRVSGGFVWLRYTQDECNYKPETVVRKPVVAGDYVRVWRGPAKGLRGRVSACDPNDDALLLNSTDWVNRFDVVAVKP